MRRLGRVLALIAIIGFAIALSSASAPIRDALNHSAALRSSLGVVGAATALAAFGGWGLAIYHWGTRYQGRAGARRWWGIAVIAGVFIGSWCYWFFAGRRASDTAEAAA